MKRALLLAAALLTACQPTPEDPFYLVGMALAPDQSPLVGQTVQVDRLVQLFEEDPNRSEWGAVTVETIREPVTVATVEDDGVYVAEVLYFYVMSQPRKQPSLLIVTLPEGPAHGAVDVSLWPGSGGDVELPTMTPWSIDLEPLLSGRPFDLAEQPAPIAPEGQPAVSFSGPVDPTGEQPEPDPDQNQVRSRVELHAPDGLAWTATRIDALDDWLLEDFELTGLPHAQWYGVPLISPLGSSSFTIDWWGRRVSMPKGARLPASRQATCVNVAELPCPLIDGRLQKTNVNVAHLRFASPTGIRRVVLRGVELSPDASLVLEARASEVDDWTSLDWPKSGIQTLRNDSQRSVMYSPDDPFIFQGEEYYLSC